MPHWLFPHYLADPETYGSAERYWQGIWEEILRATSVEKGWRSPWMSNPAPDGNPIFTAVCDSLHRGVRIIQEEPRDPSDTDLDWWIDSFGDEDQPESIRELVIACCPSRENAAQVAEMLSQWVREGKVGEQVPAEGAAPEQPKPPGPGRE